MRRFVFLAVLTVASTGGAGCGDNAPGVTGAAGSGGSGAGSLGTSGAGGGAAGAGNATTGTGGAVAQSPEEVHDSLINAQTTGGIEVTRPQPSVMPPVCE